MEEVQPNGYSLSFFRVFQVFGGVLIFIYKKLNMKPKVDLPELRYSNTEENEFFYIRKHYNY